MIHNCSSSIMMPPTSIITNRRAVPMPCAVLTRHRFGCAHVTAAAAAAACRHTRCAPSSGAAIRRDHHHRCPPQQQKQRQQQQPSPKDRAAIVASASAAAASPAAASPGAVAAAALAVVASGVANRVLYRVALVPLADHTFALALFQAFGYCIVYFAILAARRAQGKVTDAMLAAAPRRRFALTGACEALAQLLLMAGASRLPGALLPLLMQTVLIWNVFFSRVLLGVRPRSNQLLGVLLVVAGVCAASLPPAAASAATADAAPALVGPNDLQPIALCVASFAFPSLAVIVKQTIFADARARLNGRELDVIIVNAFGSLAQAAFVLALLPALTALKGLPLSALPEVIAEGARVIAGAPARPGAPVLPGSPLFPALYLAANVVFNISALALVRATSATTASLAMAAVVPLAVLAFTLPLPLLRPAVLGGTFWAGSAVLLAGLVIYNWPAPAPREAKAA